MKFLDSHPWVFFLFVVFVSTLIFWFRFSRYSNETPRLTRGYNQILLGYFIVVMIPVIILFLSDTVGGIKIQKLKELNVWSLMLHIYGLLFVLIGTWWIYFKNGAEFLKDHPGLLRFRFVVVYENISSVFWIKALFMLLMLGILTGIAFKWIQFFDKLY